MKKIILSFLLTLACVGVQSVHAMGGASKPLTLREYVRTVLKQAFVNEMNDAQLQRLYGERYARYVQAQQSAASPAAARAASPGSAQDHCTQCDKNDGELVDLHGARMCTDCAAQLLSSDENTPPPNVSEENDAELQAALTASLESNGSAAAAAPAHGGFLETISGWFSKPAAAAASAGGDDESFALALQLQQEEQLLFDEQLARSLQSELNDTGELSTDEAEGRFTYTRYAYEPTGVVPVFRQLPAIQQQGSTCGIHTVVNAQAINQCIVAGQPLNRTNSYHGGVYNNALGILHGTQSRTQNLSTQEVLALGERLNVENFYVLARIKKEPNCVILVQASSTQPLQNALEGLMHKNTGTIHFGLHLGGHWVLLSIIKEDGRISFCYMDSANGKNTTGAQYYMRFVSDTFMK